MNIITFAEAKEQGLHTYFTGQPCRHGHLTYRYTKSKACSQCVKNKAKHNATVGGGNARRWAAKTQEQRDKINAARREYYARTRDARVQERRDYYAGVKSDSSRMEQRRAYARAWKKNHSGKVNSDTILRRLSKKNRTPAWADKERIRAYYDVCAFFNEVNGYTKYHVDHIIPLQGKTVSGLHVHNNLQVILAKENIAKANRYTA